MDLYGNPYYYPSPGHPHHPYPLHPHGSYSGYPPSNLSTYLATYPSPYSAPYLSYIQPVPFVGHPHHPYSPYAYGSYPYYPPTYPSTYSVSYPSPYPASYPPYIQPVPSVAYNALYSGNGTEPIPSEADALRIDTHYPDDNGHWVPSNLLSYHSLTSKALVAGHEGWDESPLWVIRARYAGDLIPGKFVVEHGSASISFGGKEIKVDNFEVLCINPKLVSWKLESPGIVPENALVGGQTGTGEKLFIGRAIYEVSLTPGKIHPSHGCLYIPFAGREVRRMKYEILVESQ